MDSGRTSPPAVVLIAAGAAIVVAALLFVGVALSVVFAVHAVSHPGDIIGVLVWPSFLVDILIVALSLGYLAGARRLRRGDPRGLRQVALGSGAARTVAAVLVATDGLVHGYPVPIPALAVSIGLAALFFGLAWLPTRGAGRDWLDAQRSPVAQPEPSTLDTPAGPP